MKSNQKFKKKGMMLLSAVLAAFLLTMVASGYFMTLTGSFNAIKSGGEAIQAQRYAEIEANKLSLLAYNDLDSKVSQNVWKKSDADEGWEYKVNLGPEKVVDPSTNSKQRIATVSIRKEGDSTERFSMKVPVSVKEFSTGEMIIPDYDKKELIASFHGIKHYHTQQQVVVKIPKDGFLYVWVEGYADHIKDPYQYGFVGINTNLVPHSVKIGRVLFTRELFGHTGDQPWYNGENYIRPGTDVIYTLHPAYRRGYYSDIIPVSKGQNVSIMRPQGDRPTYVYLIPPKK